MNCPDVQTAEQLVISAAVEWFRAIDTSGIKADELVFAVATYLNATAKEKMVDGDRIA